MKRLDAHLDIILENRNGEEWRDVVGFDGYYSISNHGRVRSEPRMRKTGRGNGYYLSKSRILKQCGCSTQYYVQLCVSSITTSRTVSTIVADAFLRERKSNEVVMHVSKIQQDNSLNNLKIVTVSESVKRNFELGIMHSTLPIDRDKYQLSKFGVYKEGELIGRICKECKCEKSLNDFYKDLLFCKDCYGRKHGIPDDKIGSKRKYKLLRESGLQECPKCKQTKPFSEYRKDKHRINGVTSNCKECLRK